MSQEDYKEYEDNRLMIIPTLDDPVNFSLRVSEGSMLDEQKIKDYKVDENEVLGWCGNYGVVVYASLKFVPYSVKEEVEYSYPLTPQCEEDELPDSVYKRLSFEAHYEKDTITELHLNIRVNVNRI